MFGFDLLGVLMREVRRFLIAGMVVGMAAVGLPWVAAAGEDPPPRRLVRSSR